MKNQGEETLETEVHMMTKYAQVHHMVTRLTDDPAFRTFFTLYLMAETDVERSALDTRLWQEVANLPESEQQLIRAEFTRCFLKLQVWAAQLLEKAQASASA